jgi:hypothetical protein
MNYFSGRLNQSQREELALIEQAYDNPHECKHVMGVCENPSNLVLQLDPTCL